MQGYSFISKYLLRKVLIDGSVTKLESLQLFAILNFSCRAINSLLVESFVLLILDLLLKLG